MRKIKIGEDRYIGESEEAYIIAEIGSNFDNSLERAKKLISLAKEAGADCAKFQSFKTSKILSKEGFKRIGNSSFQQDWEKPVYEVYKESELPRDWHKDLVEHANQEEIDFMSSPYDREAVDLLNELNVPAFKIGSGEITNLKFLKYIAEKGKPIILSVGASTLAEIDEAVKTIRNEGTEEIILLQCVTQYPTEIEYANVSAMSTLRQAFNVPVGYSDHTLGQTVPIVATSLGASVIEKHFTDDKSREGPDHAHSLNFSEMKEMVKKVREAEKALGNPRKKVYPIEKETTTIQRRSLFAGNRIEKGEEINRKDIKILRPQLGLKPKFLDVVIGKKASQNIEKGTPIQWDHL